METFRIRYVYGGSPPSSIELVSELLGVGRRYAKELIESRGVIRNQVSAAEARRIVQLFAEIGAQVEVERTWRYVVAFDPEDPRRGDQPILRLRVGELELAIDEGPLGALEPGRPESFTDEALTQRRAVRVLERWTGAGLALADNELAMLEALSARDHELEARLREAPEGVENHLVYGDWLQARGDPRGRLIALAHAITQAADAERRQLLAREARLRARHLGHLFGPLRSLSHVLVLRWSLGFIDAAVVGPGGLPDALAGPFEVLAMLLRLPIAARMTSLGLTSELLHRPGLEALLAGSEAVAGLRRLELGDHLVPEQQARALPKFDKLWPRLGKLRELVIYGDGRPLHRLQSATLEHLELHMRSLSFEFVGCLLDHDLPALRSLALEFADSARLSPAVFTIMLTQLQVAPLRELSVGALSPLPHEFARVLGGISRLASLAQLDLSGCTVDEIAMQSLTDALDRGWLPANTRLPALIA